MKIAFDIGGVLSKYKKLREFAEILLQCPFFNMNVEVLIITDMHNIEEVYKQLDDNCIWVKRANVHVADYNKYGNMCKAILCRDLGVDILIDDFGAYLEWDSQLGPKPIMLKVMPDVFKPYWSNDWTCDGGEFGRRVAPKNLLETQP